MLWHKICRIYNYYIYKKNICILISNETNVVCKWCLLYNKNDYKLIKVLHVQLSVIYNKQYFVKTIIRDTNDKFVTQ